MPLSKLHDRNFKLVVWPWKLFSAFLNPLKRKWNIRTSLVDVFASFIYLSSTRLLFTSMNFLVPTHIFSYQYESDGHMQLTIKHHLLIVPSEGFFSKGHLPFAVLSIILSFMFFFLPMILLFVYPFSWFQRILNNISLNSPYPTYVCGGVPRSLQRRYKQRKRLSLFLGAPPTLTSYSNTDIYTDAAVLFLLPHSRNMASTVSQSQPCILSVQTSRSQLCDNYYAASSPFDLLGFIYECCNYNKTEWKFQ
jgi:hypothetical protein